jgi:hypothetical protein
MHFGVCLDELQWCPLHLVIIFTNRSPLVMLLGSTYHFPILGTFLITTEMMKRSLASRRSNALLMARLYSLVSTPLHMLTSRLAVHLGH